MKMKNKDLLFIRFLAVLAILVCLSSCASVDEPRSKRAGRVVDKYVDAIEKNLKNDPENVLLTFELASIYFKKREFGKAEKILSRILNFEKAAWQDKAVVTVRLAKMDEIQKDYKKAEKWYKKGLEYEKERGTFVVGNMGLMLENQKRYDEAFRIYAGVIERKNLSQTEREEFIMRMRALELLYNMKSGLQ